ncbi:hypothetical protein DFJ73DRAFT_17818 [Zopfochytrium polystomum]|nr:hypothetical protein DFJ73DRAFT_17818 [Zopfochytrium polystomum]
MPSLASLASLAAAFLALSMASPAAAGPYDPVRQVCDKNTLPPGWTPSNINITVKQVADAQTVNTNNKITVSGTFHIIDGCTFKIQNFIFLNALQTKWYAGVVGLDSSGQVSVNQNGVTFVSAVVPAQNGGDATFNLITQADIAYSFFSINQLRLFDVQQNELLATVDLPYQNPLASPLPGAVSATNGGIASATASTTSGTGTTSKSSAKGSVVVSPTVTGTFTLVAGLVSAGFVAMLL